MNLQLTALVLCCSATLSTTSFAQVVPTNYADGHVAYTHANIITMQTQEPIKDATLLVKDGKIEAIVPSNTSIEKDYATIDLNGGWVMPGFIDGHVHLNQSGSAYTRPDIIDATNIVAYSKEQDWLKNHLPTILSDYTQLGVTTVVDLGGPSAWLDDYAQLMQALATPAIYAAAELINTAPVPVLDNTGPVFTAISTAKEALQAVEAQLALPTKVVKFVWTGEAGLSPEALIELYQPAIKAAKTQQRIIAVHAEQLSYAKAAIIAGADILVHGVMTDVIDDEFITLAKQHGAVYMPTLTAHQHYKDVFLKQVVLPLDNTDTYFDYVSSSFDNLYAHPELSGQMFNIMTKYMPYVDVPSKAADLSKQEQAIVGQLSQLFSPTITHNQQQNLKLAANAGLKLAFGTDAGNAATLHASAIYEEIQAWLAAGMSPLQIAQAMTIGNAVAYNIDDETGTISSGKDASFVVFNTNPLTPGFPSLRPNRVIKAGHQVFINVEDAQ